MCQSTIPSKLTIYFVIFYHCLIYSIFHFIKKDIFKQNILILCFDSLDKDLEYEIHNNYQIYYFFIETTSIEYIHMHEVISIFSKINMSLQVNI